MTFSDCRNRKGGSWMIKLWDALCAWCFQGDWILYIVAWRKGRPDRSGLTEDPARIKLVTWESAGQAVRVLHHWGREQYGRLLGGPGLGARVVADNFQIASQELNPSEAEVKLWLEREQNREDVDDVTKARQQDIQRQGKPLGQHQARAERDRAEGSASRQGVPSPQGTCALEEVPASQRSMSSDLPCCYVLSPSASFPFSCN